MKTLVLDNYDSFTYNLVHCIRRILPKSAVLDIFRNDQISMENVDQYDQIVLSPGPGIPNEAGLLLPIIAKYAHKKKILGVCLGHQAIAESFGGKLIQLEKVYHGLATNIKVVKKDEKLFKGLSSQFYGGRYHSWAVSNRELPDCFDVTAIDENGIIMGISHKNLDVKGLQFHPESVLTDCGETIIANWLQGND